jgi:VIT1/CCC1 family predicted Fe2+/Mn2+ transporter
VSVGPAASLWPILVIVLVAVLGLVLGLRAGRRGPRWLRWLVVTPNGLVLLFYGFLLMFFGLGGSR